MLTVPSSVVPRFIVDNDNASVLVVGNWARLTSSTTGPFISASHLSDEDEGKGTKFAVFPWSRRAVASTA